MQEKNFQERDFKGIWIKKEIWLDTRLNALDKVILVEIDSLDGKDGCWASNDYIAKFCQCSISKVSRSIKKLCDLGFLYVESFNGRSRVLRSCLGKNPRHDEKIAEADNANIPTSNIKNSIENNNIPPNPQRGKSEKSSVCVPTKEETGFSDQLQEKFEEWVEYKKSEKKKPYKAIGLKNLVSEIRDYSKRYGDSIVIKVMQSSMSAGYQGIVWDWLEKEKSKEHARNEPF